MVEIGNAEKDGHVIPDLAHGFDGRGHRLGHQAAFAKVRMRRDPADAARTQAAPMRMS